MSHGELSYADPCGSASPAALPGTARRRMAVGIAAGGLYHSLLASERDLSLPGLQDWAGPEVGEALFVLLDACHVLIDC